MKTLLPFAMSVSIAVSALAGAPAYQKLLAVPEHDAIVPLDGQLAPILFEPAAMNVTVELQSWTGEAQNAYPADWPQHVKFTMAAADGSEPRDAQAVLVQQEPEEAYVGKRAAIDHRAVAHFRLAAIPKGKYRLTTSYHDLSHTNSAVYVVHGDETMEIRDWALQRDLEKAKTWQDVKRIQLARIANNPRNLAALLGVAAVAEEFDDYPVTKAYYERALALSHELGGASMDENIRVIQRTLDLLPRYYADRDHLIIARENLLGLGTPMSIELRERKEPRPSAPRRQ